MPGEISPACRENRPRRYRHRKAPTFSSQVGKSRHVTARAKLVSMGMPRLITAGIGGRADILHKLERQRPSTIAFDDAVIGGLVSPSLIRVPRFIEHTPPPDRQQALPCRVVKSTSADLSTISGRPSANGPAVAQPGPIDGVIRARWCHLSSMVIADDTMRPMKCRWLSMKMS